MISKDRLKDIGKYLNTLFVIHRNVEHDSEWSTEEKMILDLYDSVVYLLDKRANDIKRIKKAIQYINDEDWGTEYDKKLLQILTNNNNV